MSADLDREIDRAVREMLDVEPAAGLRTRVMQRIEEPVASGFSRKSPFSRKFVWLALPVAAAAAIVIAVLVARRAAPAPGLAPNAPTTIVKGAPAVQPPASTQAPPPGAARTVTAENRQPAVAPSPSREAQRVTAAAAVESGPIPGFPQVPSLSVPALTVSAIRVVAPAATPTEIGVDPIATPAPIDIDPLPLSPRERQNQE